MTQRLFTATALACACLAASVQAAPLTPGNLFVYRVGDGSAALTSAATAVFVDEFTTAGSFVQSLAMPTATSGLNGMLTGSGTANSDGYLSFSSDNRFLMLTGYNAAPGTLSPAGAAGTMPRTVGSISLAGITNTTTVLTDAYTGSNFRSVASTDGTSIWLGGNAAAAANAGVRYTTLGSTTSTQLSTTVINVRNVSIYGGQLYVSSSSGTTNRLSTVGTGLPTTSGQALNNLPGFATSSGSPYGFFFADLSPSVAGLDTLYVADDSIGITKYTLTGASWIANGTVGAAADAYRGLTGVVNGSSVQLFATGQGNKLVAVADGAGYGGTFAGTVTTLATAATNTGYRGVAYLTSPIPEPGTYALMLAGMAALGFVARRRRG